MFFSFSPENRTSIYSGGLITGLIHVYAMVVTNSFTERLCFFDAFLWTKSGLGVTLFFYFYAVLQPQLSRITSRVGKITFSISVFLPSMRS